MHSSEGKKLIAIGEFQIKSYYYYYKIMTIFYKIKILYNCWSEFISLTNRDCSTFISIWHVVFRMCVNFYMKNLLCNKIKSKCFDYNYCSLPHFCIILKIPAHVVLKLFLDVRGQSKCDGTRAETRFRLLSKQTSPFKTAGASVWSTAGSRGVRICSSNAGYTVFLGSVKSTDNIILLLPTVNSEH